MRKLRIEESAVNCRLSNLIPFNVKQCETMGRWNCITTASLIKAWRESRRYWDIGVCGIDQ